MYNQDVSINLLVNIITSIARDKHNKRIKCHCEENDYPTIVVSLDEIKDKFNESSINFYKYEYFFYTFNRKKFLCITSYELLITYYLKKRLRYEFLS